MKRILINALFLLIIFITGCGQQAVVLHKQDSCLYKNFTVALSKKVKSLNITMDSGKLQIYCWNKPEISCEVKHTVRDKKTAEQLQQLLKKFSIKTGIKNNICHISVDYNGSIKNTDVFASEIKLTIPQQINSIDLTQEQGDFIMEDKFEGNIHAKMRTVNSELKALYGSLSVDCQKGNVRLDSGKLTGDSDVKTETGNIYIKTECADRSDYSFQTGTGNIELAFPATAGIKLDALGTISHNQFTGSEGDIKVIANTKIGKISVNGY